MLSDCCEHCFFWHRRGDSFCGYCDNKAKLTGEKHLCEMFSIKSGEWFSVNYELPDIGDKVEMLIDSGDYIKIKVDKITVDNRGTFFSDGRCAFKVLSWRDWVEDEKPFTFTEQESEPRYKMLFRDGDHYLALYDFTRLEVERLCDWLNKVWMSTVDKKG